MDVAAQKGEKIKARYPVIRKMENERGKDGEIIPFQELSKHPVVKTMLNLKNKEGDPPIIQLLKQQRFDLVNILLESPEIDLNVCDSAGQDVETIAR